MCGLFGWIGKFNRRERRLLAGTLSLANTQRGSDSWGFCHRQDYSWIRTRGLGGITKAVEKIESHEAIMAHTRAATYGKVTVGNAHPFRRGDIYLAHNGMIYNARTVDPTVDVDSEILADRVANEKPIDDLHGYGTITWVDQTLPGNVYLANVGNGDLAVACVLTRSGSVRGAVWSSTETHLRLALQSAGLRYTIYRTKEGRIYLATYGGLFHVAGRTLRIGRHGSYFRGCGWAGEDSDNWDWDSITRQWSDNTQKRIENPDASVGANPDAEFEQLEDDSGMTPSEKEIRDAYYTRYHGDV